MTRQVKIEFLGDSKDLQRSINDVDGSSSKLHGTLSKVGKVAMVGLAAGAVVAGGALIKMTQGAIEDEAAAAKLATTLKNAAGATDTQVAAAEKWITAQGKAFGVTDDELRPALARLATATGDVGKAQKLASLAMDVSAGTGKSLESVSTALMKAQNGQVSGLSKLGIETKNAAGETLTFAQVTKSMADTFGGQAAVQADTLQGKMTRLKVILTEAGEEIGAKLIPKLTEFAGWIIGTGIPALSKMAGFVADNSTAFKVLGGVLAAVVVTLGVISVATTIHSAVTTIASAATKAWAATQWLLNAALAANPIGLVIIALVALGAGLVIAWKHSETFREVVTNALNKVKDAATAVGNFFTNTLPNFFKEAWASAKSHTQDGIDRIHNWVTGIPGKITNALSNLRETVVGLFDNAWSAGRTKIENIATNAIQWVSTIPNKITNALSNLRETVSGIFDAAMDAGKTKVINIGGTIVGWIDGIPGKLRDKIGDFKSAGASLIGAVVDGMKNAGGVIEGIASNVWTAVKSLLNGAIDRINAALSFTISLPGPDLHVNAGNIGHLARGTMNWRGGPTWVGENGPEILNLPRGSQVIPNNVATRGGSGSPVVTDDRPLLVQLILDGKVLEEALIRRSRDTGRPLAFRTT